MHAEASWAPRAVSAMSHIAHAELPWLPGTTGREDSSQGTPKLHVAIPLSAAMAICALHLELSYGEKSDGQKDVKVPGLIIVKPDRKLDHAWMVYSPSRKEPNEPNAAQMCEALLKLLLKPWEMEARQYHSNPRSGSKFARGWGNFNPRWQCCRSWWSFRSADFFPRTSYYGSSNQFPRGRKQLNSFHQRFGWGNLSRSQQPFFFWYATVWIW